MLGNFSFGDYFKLEAIDFAWELLTKVYALPAERLWITVYHTDDEAYDHWHQVIGVPAARIIRIGDNKGAPYASDNFWQMADTGPCGPCSEIFYDHGAHIAGGPPGSPDEDGDRYIEIWNLVFMQFERHADGRLTPLPKPCVDTGMGLERLSAVLQGVHSNYEIDSFVHLLKAAAKLAGQTEIEHPSLRVIADHIRACAFMIVDGVLPGNEGRGYVLRRIIRRALRHGHKLGAATGFFHQMVAPLVEVMGEAYPELVARREMVRAALAGEEERFAETLDAGMRVFEDIAARSDGLIAGADVFKLYDTFGFPADLTADVARERGLQVDQAGFDSAMQAAREKSRQASHFGGGFGITAEQSQGLDASRFLGYESLTAEHCRVQRILVDGEARGALNPGERAVIILDRTPFYAESGGQVGDTGVLRCGEALFRVEDTIKLAGVYHGHSGVLEGGQLSLQDELRAEVNGGRRQAVVLNHSATHLLHAALRAELGEHVSQKGSLVAPDKLRFDFSHFQPMSAEQLARVERQVNQAIRANARAEAKEMAFDEAIGAGAMALFGEKYGDRVRVLRMGEFSTELCGGTHVQALGDIGLFRIVAEGGVAAGIRRIEAVTGDGALDFVARREGELARAAGMVGSAPDGVADKVALLLERLRGTERELESLKAKAASAASGDLVSQAVDVDGVKVLAVRLEGVEAKQLREMIDGLKDRLGDCAVLLAAAKDGKVSLAAGVGGKGLVKIKAGDLLQQVARQINGKGGGRPDMAQGGGDDLPVLPELLEGVVEWVRGRS
jgi:alanyl-tRNA synthetase